MDENLPDIAADAPELLTLDQLHQFAYCPRLFHLMHVEGRWADNAFTVEGKAVHRRVDALDHVLPDPDRQFVVVDGGAGFPHPSRCGPIEATCSPMDARHTSMFSAPIPVRPH